MHLPNALAAATYQHTSTVTCYFAGTGMLWGQGSVACQSAKTGGTDIAVSTDVEIILEAVD